MFMRPRLLLTVDLVTAPVLLVAYVLAIREYGAVGAAWVTSVSRLCKAGLAQLVAWRLALSGEATSAAAAENETARASSP